MQYLGLIRNKIPILRPDLDKEMKKRTAVFIICVSVTLFIKAQNGDNYQEPVLPQGFISVENIPATPVQDQGNTGTCWSFATLSFLESELLRIEDKVYNFSEMYPVKKVYLEKADKYIRMKGNIYFGQGGQLSDALHAISEYGIVPEKDYPGLNTGESYYDHADLYKMLKAYLDDLVSNHEKEVPESWKEEYIPLLDVYLGQEPDTITVGDVKYTPREYAASLPLNLDDYIVLSSFTHHPFYSSFSLEVPDNWSCSSVFNITLDDLVETADYSLQNGYSLVLMTDFTERGFMDAAGFVVAPKRLYAPATTEEAKMINSLSDEAFQDLFGSIDNLPEELLINQENRQVAFDHGLTTDDHAMHITGLVKSPEGKVFYQVKNSWGIGNPYKGYLYLSQAYFKYKTVAIMVNKDAIPENIRSKLDDK